MLHTMAVGKKSSGRIYGGSDKDEYSAYARSVNPMITCDVCGEKYPKSEMRQCAKCGMIVCPSCWPQHRCEMDRSPLLKVRRRVERNAEDSPAFWKPIEKAFQFVLEHKRQVLVALGILVVILIVVIAVNAGGHDPIEGTWTTTEDGVSLSLKLYDDGTGALFTSDLGIEIAHNIAWRKVDSTVYPYSISVGDQWYPNGNSRLSADNTLLTIGTNNTASYLKDMVLTFAKVK